MEEDKLSKIISHALRHKPEDYNLKLSEDGWVSINELVVGIRNNVIGYSELEAGCIIKLISASIKKRHEIKDGHIRALHGHSLKLKSISKPVTPFSKLFHATALKYWDKIRQEGLSKRGRTFVHLSANVQSAIEVATKKYKTIVLLQIDAVKASDDGILFYNNDQGLTWLCEYVSPQYISIIIE